MEEQKKPKTLIKGYRSIAKYVRDTYKISLYYNYLGEFKEKFAFPLFRINSNTYYSSEEDIAEWVVSMTEKDLYNKLLIRDWQKGGKTKQFGEPRQRKYKKRKKASWGKTRIRNILRELDFKYSPERMEERKLLGEAIGEMLNGKMKNKEIIKTFKLIYKIAKEYG